MIVFVVAVANTKGGVGKSTVATHLAAHYSLRGAITAIADFDRQKSSLAWLKRRPDTRPPILGIKARHGKLEIPQAATHLIVDTSAALSSKAVQDVVKHADLIVIPTLPSVFDEDGILRFLKHLSKLKPIKKNKRPVTFVINRNRYRAKAVDHMARFLADHDFPVSARLRDTQMYVGAAAQGLSLFDMNTARSRSYAEEWAPLLDFLDQNEPAEL